MRDVGVQNDAHAFDRRRTLFVDEQHPLYQIDMLVSDSVYDLYFFHIMHQ